MRLGDRFYRWLKAQGDVERCHYRELGRHFATVRPRQRLMLQVTPHMRILVAIERVDGRKGIDSLTQLCREKLAEDPFSGCLFLFLNQSGTTLKGLCYDLC